MSYLALPSALPVGVCSVARGGSCKPLPAANRRSMTELVTPADTAVVVHLQPHKLSSLPAIVFGVAVVSLFVFATVAYTMDSTLNVGRVGVVMAECTPATGQRIQDETAVALANNTSLARILPGASTLLIIQGGIRTFDLCVDSILDNLCHNNGGCRIVLSLSSEPLALSATTRRKLEPYLIAEYYRESTDVIYPWYIFELRVTSATYFAQSANY